MTTGNRQYILDYNGSKIYPYTKIDCILDADDVQEGESSNYENSISTIVKNLLNDSLVKKHEEFNDGITYLLGYNVSTTDSKEKSFVNIAKLAHVNDTAYTSHGVFCSNGKFKTLTFSPSIECESNFNDCFNGTIKTLLSDNTTADNLDIHTSLSLNLNLSKDYFSKDDNNNLIVMHSIDASNAACATTASTATLLECLVDTNKKDLTTKMVGSSSVPVYWDANTCSFEPCKTTLFTANPFNADFNVDFSVQNDRVWDSSVNSVDVATYINNSNSSKYHLGTFLHVYDDAADTLVTTKFMDIGDKNVVKYLTTGIFDVSTYFNDDSYKYIFNTFCNFNFEEDSLIKKLPLDAVNVSTLISTINKNNIISIDELDENLQTSINSGIKLLEPELYKDEQILSSTESFRYFLTGCLYNDTSTGTLHVAKSSNKDTGIYFKATFGLSSIDTGTQYSTKLYQTSDETLKTFTSDIDINFDNLATIKKGEFYWKNDLSKTPDLGVSAQSVEALYPQIVDEVDGIKSISYDRLGVIALAAIDKLHLRIKTLEKEIEHLKKELSK